MPGILIRFLTGSVTFAVFSRSWDEMIDTDAGASKIFSDLLEAEITTSFKFWPNSKTTSITWSADVISILLELNPT